MYIFWIVGRKNTHKRPVMVHIRFPLHPGKHKILVVSRSLLPLRRFLYTWTLPSTRGFMDLWYLAIQIVSELLEGSKAHPIIPLIIKGWQILEHEPIRLRTSLLPAKQDKICHPHTFFNQPLEGSNSDWFLPGHHTFHNPVGEQDDGKKVTNELDW